MNVVIIGASGFLGTTMVDYFSCNNHTVFAYDCRENDSFPHGVIFQKIDVISEAVVFPEEIDVVFYLAQSPFYKEFPGKADHIFGVNSFGAIKAAQEALKKKVRCFCYASTGNVYNPSFNAIPEDHPLNRNSGYGLSKIMAEEALDLFNINGMKTLSVRLFGLFGPGQKTMLPVYLKESIINNRRLYLDPAEFDKHEVNGLEVSFSFCPDIVKCLEQIVQKALRGESLPLRLNLASHEPVSIRRFAKILGKCLGKEPVYSISGNYRTFNLIADTGLLKKVIDHDFIAFENAMEMTYR